MLWSYHLESSVSKCNSGNVISAIPGNLVIVVVEIVKAQ